MSRRASGSERLGAGTTLMSVAVAVLLFVAACGGSPSSQGAAKTVLRLYTSAEQSTVDAVLKIWRQQHPSTTVQVYRAPTGQINARLAAEQRAGGIQADVLWGADPLTFYGYERQGLLLHWTPANVSAVPAADRGPSFWGTTVLQLVLVARKDLATPPTSWQDLTAPALRGAVEIPNPGFAASAMGGLGWFAQTPGYGLDFFRKLKANGAVQVDSPATVLTDIAEGRRKVGMTIDFIARAAIKKGSPVQLVWPEPGAIGVYAGAAVLKSSREQPTARTFVEFLLSAPVQEALAKLGRQPVLPQLAGRFIPAGKQTVVPDWPAVAASGPTLLADYRKIFGG